MDLGHNYSIRFGAFFHSKTLQNKITKSAIIEPYKYHAWTEKNKYKLIKIVLHNHDLNTL